MTDTDRLPRSMPGRWRWAMPKRRKISVTLVQPMHKDARACLSCGSTEQAVVNSRPTADRSLIRRLKCADCGARWSTVEVRAEAASGAGRVIEWVARLKNALDIEWPWPGGDEEVSDGT